MSLSYAGSLYETFFSSSIQDLRTTRRSLKININAHQSNCTVICTFSLLIKYGGVPNRKSW